MDYYKESLKIHEKNMGKWASANKVKIENMYDLSTAYTPGVAEPCLQIKEDSLNIYKYTSKQNTVAVITDGSAVLGLGNIGPEAAIPVMEGKAALLKAFAQIDAVPICLNTQDTNEIINIVRNISATFGAINLEDISAPRCFEIEEKLQESLNIPVFHYDQHGTAVVFSAAIINASKIVKKEISDLKVVISGDGAAGTAITKMLVSLGIKDIIVCGIDGIINKKNAGKRTAIANITNYKNIDGDLSHAVIERDVFVGVSAPGILTEEMIRTMANDSIVFAMANPEPEIMPQLAKEAGARIIGTGRSDYNNQINNVLAFPGIFRGALDGNASRITENMKKAAAFALADFVKKEELSEDKILPEAFEKGIATVVGKAVQEAWRKENEV